MSHKNTTASVWNRVDKSGGATACWTWMGFKNKKGYGVMSLSGRLTLTHRLAWTDTNGIVPDRMLVCHHCDNPACCNPLHMFIGTVADNTLDMIRKGRHIARRGVKNGMNTQPHRRPRGDANGARTKPQSLRRGERNHAHKLSETQVSEIRARLVNGESWRSIGRAYGVSHQCVGSIARGKTRRIAVLCRIAQKGEKHGT